VERLIDWFIPPAVLERSPEHARQARFAVALAWISVGFFVAAMLVQGPVNSRALLVMNALSALLCVAAPFVLKWVGRPALICHGVLAIAYVKYLSIALLLRGAGLSGATVLLAQLPLVATFLIGVRAGVVWAILSIGSGIAIGLLGRAGLIADHLPASHKLINDHFILVISTALLLTIAVLYERTRSAAQRSLQAIEARRQAAEIERLQIASKLRLAEAEQLASLGRIAAATAHEINNPLAAVVANLEVAAESLPAQRLDDLSSSLEDALAAAHRIRHIVRDMALCSQAPSGTLGPVSVAQAVELALKMVQPRLRTRVPVQVRLDPALPPVVAETGRLAQVLLNLLLNAAQAMPDGPAESGEIVVEGRAADGMVVLEVRDTGGGIPPEIVDKVKEPFFTTRAIGEGAGLGLALCEGSMRSFGGSMRIESRPGRTVVTLVLVPTAESSAGSTAGPAPRAAPGPTAAGVALDILIIDDDEAVARTLKRALTPHTVTLAAGGRQALELLTGTRRFDLVFCDLMMPDVSGIEVFEGLRASHPGRTASIVFITGGSFTERAQAFRTSVPNTFVSKPFDLQQIREVVRRFIDRRAPA